MGHNSVVSGHPKSIEIPWADRLSTGPPDLGSHKFSPHQQNFEKLKVLQKTLST